MEILPFIRGKIRKYWKDADNKSGALNSIFLYFGVASLFCVFCLFVFTAGVSLKTAFAKNTQASAENYLESPVYQDSFAESAQNFMSFSPDIMTIQQNSAFAVSTPAAVDSKTLGSIIGEVETIGTEAKNTSVEYSIEPGETISSIAAKFNISINTILWANNLSKGSVVKAGQELIILPVSGVMHLVKNGDVLSGIAKIYGADMKEIIDFNGLSDEGDIYIGDILIIPGGKMPAKPIIVSNIPFAESYFIFPCEGKITQGSHGALGSAVDIANSYGKPIVAAAGGIIQRAGAIPVGGKRITILHPNGVVTYYGHLSSILAVSGQVVAAGEIIGYMGNSGYATGPHLHFEVRGAVNFLGSYPVGSYISWKAK